MLNSQNRLRAKTDFDRVKREGKRWRGDLLSATVLQRGEGPSRYGFVVSKQVGKAAARNHLKRRLRAIIRRALPSLPPGYDVVLVARPAASAAAFHDLDTATRALLKAAGLLDAPYVGIN